MTQRDRHAGMDTLLGSKEAPEDVVPWKGPEDV